jgi:uncharacterized protein YggU (UPF0235/DUF167 family)
MMKAEPWRLCAEGLEVTVRVTPRCGRDGLTSVWIDAAGQPWLLARVAAPTEGNRAHDALIRLLAGAFGVPHSAMNLLTGAASRNKRLLVWGGPVARRQRRVALAGDASGQLR